jgi:hypothetical protein
MRTTRSPHGRFHFLALFIGLQLCLSGCNDESKTSGTMVQVSEEAKQHIQSRREVYKSKAQPRKEPTKVEKKRSL